LEKEEKRTAEEWQKAADRERAGIRIKRGHSVFNLSNIQKN